MAAIHHGERRIVALRPRKAVRDVCDHKLMGFGVCVLRLGANGFVVNCQRDDGRIRRIVGQAASIEAEEARSRARTVLAPIRGGAEIPAPALAKTLLEVVAEEVIRRWGRNWKITMSAGNRNYCKNCILPRSGGRAIGSIDAAGARR